jgi:hypothetical protein
MQSVARPYPDSAHADFWRASPEGRMFLLRGYIEDSVQTLAGLPSLDGRKIEPGKTFDLENTTWSIGECFLHAVNVASLLAPGRDVRLHLQARWYGVAGRRLVVNCINQSNNVSFAAGVRLPWSIRRVPHSDSNLPQKLRWLRSACGRW